MSPLQERSENLRTYIYEPLTHIPNVIDASKQKLLLVIPALKLILPLTQAEPSSMLSNRGHSLYPSYGFLKYFILADMNSLNIYLKSSLIKGSWAYHWNSFEVYYAFLKKIFYKIITIKMILLQKKLKYRGIVKMSFPQLCFRNTIFNQNSISL